MTWLLCVVVDQRRKKTQTAFSLNVGKMEEAIDILYSDSDIDRDMGKVGEKNETLFYFPRSIV